MTALETSLLVRQRRVDLVGKLTAMRATNAAYRKLLFALVPVKPNVVPLSRPDAEKVEKPVILSTLVLPLPAGSAFKT